MTIQVVLRHVLIAAVLTLILLDVRMRIHVMIQLGLREVPKKEVKGSDVEDFFGILIISGISEISASNFFC